MYVAEDPEGQDYQQRLFWRARESTNQVESQQAGRKTEEKNPKINKSIKNIHKDTRSYY